MTIWEYAELVGWRRAGGTQWTGPDGAPIREPSTTFLQRLNLAGQEGWDVITLTEVKHWGAVRQTATLKRPKP